MQTSFLHNHAISIVHVENLTTQPYNKDDQYIRAFMSEIVSVFKDIAQLNPLFRDQITNFSINQVASNVFDEPDKLADFAAAVSTGEVGELQDVLESLVVDDRLRKALLVSSAYSEIKWLHRCGTYYAVSISPTTRKIFVARYCLLWYLMVRNFSLLTRLFLSITSMQSKLLN